MAETNVYFVLDEMQDITNHQMMAVIEQAKILKKLGYDPILLTTNFNVVQRSVNANYDFDLHIMSLFEFFAETTVDQPNDTYLYFNELPMPKAYEIFANNVEATVRNAEIDLAYIHFFDYIHRGIRDVVYLDSYRHQRQQDWYDYRGFKVAEDISTPEGNMIFRRFFDRAGHEKITFSYDTNQDGYLLLTGILLPEYQGKAYSFDDMDSLQKFFFQEVAKKAPKNIFFLGGTGNTFNNLLQAKLSGINRIYQLTGTDFIDPATGQISANYQQVLNAQNDAFVGFLLPKTNKPLAIKDQTVADRSFVVQATSNATTLKKANLGDARPRNNEFNIIYYERENQPDATTRLIEYLDAVEKSVHVYVLGNLSAEHKKQLTDHFKDNDHIKLDVIGIQFHDRLISYLDAGDVFVSFNNGYSYTLNEAARFGMKMLLSQTDDVDPQLMTSGLVETVQSAEEFANTIATAKKNEQMRIIKENQSDFADWQALID